MKLGCSSWSFDAAFRARRMDLREWIRRCATEMELDGIELADAHIESTDGDYLREIKKLCVDLQLTIAGIAVTNDFADPDRRQDEAARVRQWCDIAAVLGAPVVRIYAGQAPAAPLEPEPGRIVGLFRKVFGQGVPDPRRTWSDVSWTLHECAQHAQDRGVVLALQNNTRAGMVATPEEIERGIHDAGSEWLRVCLDPADLPYTMGVEPLIPLTVQTHARMRLVRDDGSDTKLHWPELLRMMRLGGYRGFVLIDYDGIEDPETAVPRAARYLRGVLLTLARRELLGPGTNGNSGDIATTIEATPTT